MTQQRFGVRLRDVVVCGTARVGGEETVADAGGAVAA
jgi:hypothetical protein